MNEQQTRIKLLAENLLATLDAVIPSTTVHYAVTEAQHALKTLAFKADTIHTAAPSTWTFCGHWSGDDIVIDYVLPGEVQDDREDINDEYPEGLWAGSASGYTVEQAEAAAIAEYTDTDECDGHESLTGPIGTTTYCDGACR